MYCICYVTVNEVVFFGDLGSWSCRLQLTGSRDHSWLAHGTLNQICIRVGFLLLMTFKPAKLKGMSDERQSRPTFVGVVELPDIIGRQNR